VWIDGTPYTATSGATFALSVAALVAAIGSGGTVTATAPIGSPDEVLLTANTPGAAGNSISLAVTSPAGTNTMTISAATLTGGVDAIENVLIGTQGNQGERTGMYCLEGAASPIDAVWLCGFTDSENWATVGEFAQSINAQGYVSFATGQTVAQVVAAKIGALLDNPYLLADKDWVTFTDSYLNGNYAVPPSCVVAGEACSLSAEQSVGNKPVSGIIGTEATLGANPSPYSNADLALLEANGIGVITNPIPLGQVFGRRHGRTTSSNVATRENTYGSKTNDIVRNMSVLLGQFVNLVQSTQQNDPVRLGVNSVLNGYFGPQETAFEINAFKVTCDLTNNTPASIAAGYLYATVRVSYMAVINYFIVNLTAGQTVSVSVSPSS